ncbi:MAG: glycosyltransferase [Phycisphaerales bacterium]|nr:glycosyltransferase [Phycisphaerae bacterium]NNF44344.1 glycosyltransferase [Phycisphaerales bacterium]NNM25623.1 glycosyltransferase [Phycisphaerales bacterium]
MNVLMLGWEFPPFITGGLGTACYGLTRALDQHGVRITFMLPRAVDATHAAHVTLLGPQSAAADTKRTPSPGRRGRPAPHAVDDPAAVPAMKTASIPASTPAFAHTKFLTVPTRIVHPYAGAAGDRPVAMPSPRSALRSTLESTLESTPTTPPPAPATRTAGPRADPPSAAAGSTPAVDDAGYGHDLMGEVERYAAFCLDAAADLDFDVIHAHDWLTYPAGLWIARHTGRPLVVHVHSTEFDRSGEQINQTIYDIERRGMHGAMRVIAVSQLTRDVVTRRYGVPPGKVDVVYNGVDIDTRSAGISEIRGRDKIVLYFGRITFQKGPEYFVRAAKRVLEHIEDVKFVVAGSGDQARSMIEMAAGMGIGHKVLFTGFLRGDDIRRVFEIADLYVMPSVSEPFGIAPLEAMGHDVPVLISNTSGVSEVLTHALKVDFWDVDDMANKIIAVLRHPPLGQMLRTHGRMEVRQLTWDGAARECEEIYGRVIGEMAVV